MRPRMLVIAMAALATMLAAPAQAGGGAPPGGGGGDPDANFAHELQSYGIYGPRDYNAWLGKIVCERLYAGVDGDAAKSVRFIHPNLQRETTEAQAWQFLGASINTYCPEQRPVFEKAAAEQHG